MPATEFDDEITSVVATLGSLVRAPAIVTSSATPVADLRRMLAHRRVPAIAIVDRDDQLRGIVTRTDVLRAGPDATAADVMSAFVFVLPATAAIEKAAALMAYEGVGQVVVVGDDGLVGMVSAVDIARHLAVLAGYLRE